MSTVSAGSIGMSRVGGRRSARILLPTRGGADGVEDSPYLGWEGRVELAVEKQSQGGPVSGTPAGADTIAVSAQSEPKGHGLP